MVGVYSIEGSVALQVGIYDDICVALDQSHPLKLSAVLVIRHLWHLIRPHVGSGTPKWNSKFSLTLPVVCPGVTLLTSEGFPLSFSETVSH